MTRRSPLFVFLACLVVLAACSGDDDIPPPCPIIAPLPDATNMTRFQGEGRDLTDVDFSAQIANVNFACDYDDAAVEMDMEVVFEATRGPANESGVAQFGYFVAIGRAGSPQQVLAREEFPVTVEFEGNRRRLLFLDELLQRFPLAEGEDGSSYVVYIGLLVSREELNYNRANR